MHDTELVKRHTLHNAGELIPCITGAGCKAAIDSSSGKRDHEHGHILEMIVKGIAVYLTFRHKLQHSYISVFQLLKHFLSSVHYKFFLAGYRSFPQIS